MVDTLKQHPAWKINLEIEPETWDRAKTNDPIAYAELQALAADQTAGGRIEFVNPAYAQPYLWNIPGESIVRQFQYGIKKVREHFPGAIFSTYCSEEPCFTSALPGILKSFGYRNAALKNPDTCWGGYVRAFGGELVNWVGPDGAGLPTSPRYEVEALQPPLHMADDCLEQFVNLSGGCLGRRHSASGGHVLAGCRLEEWSVAGRPCSAPVGVCDMACVFSGDCQSTAPS